MSGVRKANQLQSSGGFPGAQTDSFSVKACLDSSGERVLQALNRGATAICDSVRLVDLTLTLRRGQHGVDWEVAKTVERDGWNARTLHLYSHTGTHMDAPIHFGVGSESIDQLSLDRFMGPAWVVRPPNLPPRALIEVAQLGSVAGSLGAGDSLLLHTGWSSHVNCLELYRDGLPRVSEALARWCVERQVKILGVEPPSVADVNNLPEVTLIHHILLGGGVGIVEGLTNLEQCRERKRSLLHCHSRSNTATVAPAVRLPWKVPVRAREPMRLDALPTRLSLQTNPRIVCDCFEDPEKWSGEQVRVAR